MASLPTIICENCHDEVPVGRRWAATRKYCKLCQIIRDTQPSGRACDQCGRTFFPLRSTWMSCADCTSIRIPLSKLEHAPNCNMCGKRRPPADELEQTCLDCVQSSPEYRAAYISKIKEIVAKRREILFSTTPKASNGVL